MMRWAAVAQPKRTRAYTYWTHLILKIVTHPLSSSLTWNYLSSKHDKALMCSVTESDAKGGLRPVVFTSLWCGHLSSCSLFSCRGASPSLANANAWLIDASSRNRLFNNSLFKMRPNVPFVVSYCVIVPPLLLSRILLYCIADQSSMDDWFPNIRGQFPSACMCFILPALHKQLELMWFMLLYLCAPPDVTWDMSCVHICSFSQFPILSDPVCALKACYHRIVNWLTILIYCICILTSPKSRAQILYHRRVLGLLEVNLIYENALWNNKCSSVEQQMN